MAKTWRRKRKCSLVFVRILGAIWAKDQDLLGRNYPSQRKRRQVTSRPASVCCTMNLPPLRVVKKNLPPLRLLSRPHMWLLCALRAGILIISTICTWSNK